MGELLNNLLKWCFIGIWFIAFAGGFYISGSLLATDVQRGVASNHYQHARTAHARQHWKVIYNIPTWMLARHFLLTPGDMLTRIKRTWPLLNHPSVAIGKSNIGPHIPDRILYRHIMPPPILFLIIAGLLQGLAYPVLRAKLARHLADTNRKIFGRIKDLPRGDGFVLADKVRLDGGGNPHVLTIAPSGGGKSATQAIPSLLKLPDDCSVIVTDPKGELLARCAPWLKERGHKIYVLGPLEGYGNGWDPLRACRDADEVRVLARQLLVAASAGEGQPKDPTWINLSRACLSSYLLQAWIDDKGLTAGFQMLNEDEADGTSIKDDGPALDFRLFSGMLKSGGTSGSVVGTINSSASAWMMDKVTGWMACERAFEMDNIRKEKAAVFLVSGSSNAEELQQIQYVFFTMLFNRLAEGGDGRVRILLDEFANLGRIQGVDRALNLLRSADVSLHAITQNLSQLNAVYGRDVGAVVAESFGTYCVMGGLKKDAEDLGKLLGLKDDIRANYSTQDEKLRAMYAQNQLAALEGSALRQIKSDQVLIISGNHKPVMAKLRAWYLIKSLKQRVLKVFWADWKEVPMSVKAKFFMKFGNIDPKPVVLNLRKDKPGKEDQGRSREQAQRVEVSIPGTDDAGMDIGAEVGVGHEQALQIESTGEML